MKISCADSEVLYQVTSLYYCAGLIFRNGLCRQAAPILHWAIGKTEDYLLKYFRDKGFEVTVFKVTDSAKTNSD